MRKHSKYILYLNKATRVEWRPCDGPACFPGYILNIQLSNKHELQKKTDILSYKAHKITRNCCSVSFTCYTSCHVAGGFNCMLQGPLLEESGLFSHVIRHSAVLYKWILIPTLRNNIIMQALHMCFTN